MQLDGRAIRYLRQRYKQQYKIFLLQNLLRDTSAWSLKKTKEGRVRKKLSCHQNVSSNINLWQLLFHCASDLIMKKSLVCLAGMLSLLSLHKLWKSYSTINITCGQIELRNMQYPLSTAANILAIWLVTFHLFFFIFHGLGLGLL